MGTVTVSVAGMRLTNSFATDSLVAQLLPQSKVTICLMKIHSCSQTGLFRPSCSRIASIDSGLALRAPRITAGSLPKYLKRKKTSSTTPSRVGIICHRRLMRYAAIAADLQKPSVVSHRQTETPHAFGGRGPGGNRRKSKKTEKN